MKKSLLSLSIGAFIGGLTLAGAANAAVSIAGSAAAGGEAKKLTATNATALEVNAGGIGHIGVIPYFSTQNGNQTLFGITNTDTANGKVLKVRFRSAANSDDVFDFTLFLSPGDVWTANVSKDAATGLSKLTTSDNSCTLPATAGINRTFITDRLPAVSSTFTADKQASWTREGYIEVLNVADVPSTLVGAAATTANPLYATTKHASDGTVKCDTATLETLLTDFSVKVVAGAPVARTPAEAEEALAAAGLDTPSGGIYTTAFIINTANAFLSWSTEPTAVRAVSAPGVSARGRVVISPQNGGAVATAVAQTLTSDPLLRLGTAAGATGLSAQQFDFPDLSTPYVNSVAAPANGLPTIAAPVGQANDLSKALATTAVKNDYSTLAAIGSKTDFTFSLPTRRYGAALSYLDFKPYFPLSAGASSSATTDSTYFGPGNTTVATTDKNLLCVTPGGAVAGSIVGYDRSERQLAGSGAVVSPGQAAVLAFCGEVSVLTINNDKDAPAGKGVLAASVAVQNFFTGFQEGWVNITTPGVTGTIGLPVLGSAYTSAIGAPVGGVATNFGWTYKHKTVAPVAP